MLFRSHDASQHEFTDLEKQHVKTEFGRLRKNAEIKRNVSDGKKAAGATVAKKEKKGKGKGDKKGKGKGKKGSPKKKSAAAATVAAAYIDPEGGYGSEEGAEDYEGYYDASESEWDDDDQEYYEYAYTEDGEYTDEGWEEEEYSTAEQYLACSVIPHDEDD